MDYQRVAVRATYGIIEGSQMLALFEGDRCFR